jgi:hypothetical protein
VENKTIASVSIREIYIFTHIPLPAADRHTGLQIHRISQRFRCCPVFPLVMEIWTTRFLWLPWSLMFTINFEFMLKLPRHVREFIYPGRRRSRTDRYNDRYLFLLLGVPIDPSRGWVDWKLCTLACAYFASCTGWDMHVLPHQPLSGEWIKVKIRNFSSPRQGIWRGI